ncbi:MAG: 50S ribosomal protein L28 [Deltaproteobacteria bacterium TMED126]|jgi:large subunit ribosomal protein L28|nr:50S ribosomal protein L28 [Candidatus Dadabacteria bacterium]NSW97430.1 50S ribosomal protein L28 [Deltaproteobacteria bacterium TMED126]|tara:strand:+ start:13403 stop:13693 length:291 start_codon:yes stop_codon:yes gene_type:complete
MSKVCFLTGKRYMTGNSVSHANNKTKRKFNVNLRPVTLISDTLGEKIKVLIAASTMRTVNKHGSLDRFLLGSDNSKLSSQAIKLKNKISKKLRPNK